LIKYKKIKIEVPKIKKEIILPLIGGILYFGNASFNVMAYRYIEGSIVSMLHQLNAVWLFLLGVFIFKEINWRQHRKQLLLGIIFAILGIIALLYAQ